jgi:hypothetical protein
MAIIYFDGKDSFLMEGLAKINGRKPYEIKQRNGKIVNLREYYLIEKI